MVEEQQTLIFGNVSNDADLDLASNIERIKTHVSRVRESDQGFPARGAVATFLFMVMPVDGQLHPAEMDRLVRILSDDFDLDEAETVELIAHARGQKTDIKAMQAMADVLRADMRREDILLLMSHMWEMVFADGKLHETEVVLVERVAGLLDIPQEDVARAMTSSD